MARIAKDGRSAPLTLTLARPNGWGMTTGAERSEHRKGSTLPAGRREGARGETPRPYIELRAIRPVEIREERKRFGYQKQACYPPKTTLGFYPQRSEFWGDIR